MRRGGLAPYLAWALFSAIFWLAVVAVAFGMFGGDYMGPPDPAREARMVWGNRLFLIGAVFVYAGLSAATRRLIRRG